jgi:serine/threonine protein kinase/TPR repeat protein
MAEPALTCPACSAAVPPHFDVRGRVVCPACSKILISPVDDHAETLPGVRIDEDEDDIAIEPPSGPWDAEPAPQPALEPHSQPQVQPRVPGGPGLAAEAAPGGEGGGGRESGAAAAADSKSNPFSPRFLAQYEMVRFLGTGAMGAVHLMRQVNLGRFVAVKVVREDALTPDVARRLTREARVLASLNHANIIAIHDVGTDGALPYMVCEYVEGETLHDRMLHEPPLSLAQSLRIAMQILDGLKVAHRQGIVHRDLKPRNIFLSGKGIPKIGDFGLAKSHSVASGMSTRAIVGTPKYMSPEQCRGHETTASSDLYAVGVLLFEMASGQLPFLGPELVDYLIQHATQKPNTLRNARPDLPVALEEILARALEKDPGKRFRSALEFKRAIHAVFRTLGPVRDPAAAPSEERLEPRPGVLFADRYELVKLLGEGGMGQIWLAQDRVMDGVRVAIKLLPPELWRNPEAQANLKQEARLCQKLTHPNIVRLINLEPAASPFLVMEYVEGPTLAEELARRKLAEEGALAPRDALPIVEGLAAALDHAHERRVIHRDLKPANVILEMSHGRVTCAKLGDFGIAAEMNTFQTRQTGALPAGTLAYMSPEQVSCRKLDARSDVYSLGATLYQMLTLEPPYSGGDLTWAIQNAPPPRPEGIPGPIADVVVRALAKDPAGRPSSAGALALELRRALGLATPPVERASSGAPAIVPSPQPARARPQLWVEPAAGPASASETPGPLLRPPPPLRSATPAAPAAAPAVPAFASSTVPVTRLAPAPARAPAPAPVAGPAAVPLPEVPYPDESREGWWRAPAVFIAACGLAIWVANMLRPGPVAIVVRPSPSAAAPGPARSPAPAVDPGRSPAPPFAVAVTPRGTLWVTAEPADAEILVNGQVQGSAPCEVKVPAGQPITVVARVPGYGEGSASATAAPGQRIPIHIVLARVVVTVRLASEPGGATVQSPAGDVVGVTPCEVRASPGQLVSYTVTLAGYRPGSISTQVPPSASASRPLELSVVLDPIAEPAPPDTTGLVVRPSASPEPDRLPMTPPSPSAAVHDLFLSAKTSMEARDNARAIALFRQAAERGHARAQYRLAQYYEQGAQDIPKDENQAIRWYRKAAEQGLADAMFSLGIHHENGIVVRADPAEAVRWYRRGAVRGHAMSQNNLGACLQEGIGTPRDPVDAVRWYRKAAEGRLMDAQNNLGVCFEAGLGVARNLEQAVTWYRRAADQGEPDAQCNLGQCYQWGKGVGRDPRAAADWYRKGDQGGSINATYNLAICHERGIGVEKDPAMARKLMKKAADAGHTGAQDWLLQH